MPPTPLRGLILDMDGVLWRDSEPIGNLSEIFTRLQNQGIHVILATNNATKTIADYLEKLAGFGVALRPEQILTSAIATACHLQSLHPEGGRVFVIGEKGLIQALQEHGFDPVFSGEPDSILAVVSGLDRTFTYARLKEGARLIRSGALFFGTNPDRTFPTPEGLVPGAGALLAALEAASGVSPIIIGKPKPTMYQQALDRLGTSPSETLVVGDRLDTDIMGGQNAGCKTALVLSGVSTAEMARAWTPPPDMIAASLSQLLDELFPMV